MAGHKPSEKKKMMGGGRLYAKDGLYARRPMKKGRTVYKHGGYAKGEMPKLKPN